jgi:hypothetical protein
MSCSKNLNETCGGANANSIYQIDKSCSTTTTTTTSTTTTADTTMDITNDTTPTSTTTSTETSTKTTSSTKITTTKLPLNYIGCYSDGLTRALSGSFSIQGSVNPCVAYCKSMGFLYAGCQNR